MKVYGGENIVGWLLSEKLDGIKAHWTGRGFVARSGRAIRTPGWFRRGLPAVELDGELWLGRGRFAELTSTLQRPQDSRWLQVCYVVYDAPAAEIPFRTRLANVHAALASARHACEHYHYRCESLGHMRAELDLVLHLGGEGLCARDPSAADPDAIVKIKPCMDAEGIVVGYTPHRKREDLVGALLVEIGDGQEIPIGAGLTDAEREEPPAIGATITYRYRGVSAAGRPLQATYWRQTPAL